ncbi:hypothetical protein F5Y03DRAFT_348943 [Xylaria venustula]|nr:hypothetical protein F5Y03DRAFT_348943 [Xylaria venustula]
MDIRVCADGGLIGGAGNQSEGSVDSCRTHGVADFVTRMEQLEKRVRKLEEEIQEMLIRPSILKSPSSPGKKVRFSLNNGEQHAQPSSAKRAAPEEDAELAKIWDDCPEPLSRRPRGWKKVKVTMEQEEKGELCDEYHDPAPMRLGGWAQKIAMEEDLDDETKMMKFVDMIMSRDQDKVSEITDDYDTAKAESIEEWNDDDRARMGYVVEWRPPSPSTEIPSQFIPSDLYASAPSSPGTRLPPPCPTTAMAPQPPRSPPMGKRKAPRSPLRQMTLVDDPF